MSAVVTHAHPVLSDAERTRLARRARLLASASVTYNAVEAVVAVAAGLVAGSVALVGFGLDSCIEVSSGLIILWQFGHRLPETRERVALRAMSVAFALLAVYVSAESVRALVGGAEPETSAVGIGLTIASLLVMPFLSWAQRRTGRLLRSAAVQADGMQTALCAWLSAAVLLGLTLNALLGWAWADPVAGLVIALVAGREAVQAWRGEGCCAPGGTSGQALEDACAVDGCAAECTDACCAHEAPTPQTLTITRGEHRGPPTPA